MSNIEYPMPNIKVKTLQAVEREEGRFEGIEGGGEGGHNGVPLLGVNGENPVAQAALPFGGLEHNPA